MKITIVVSYYKALDNLIIILDALNLQSDKNFEVIVSEDDNNEETGIFLKKIAPTLKYKVHHIFQNEDKGFRKNIMLNKAILICTTDYMVFIDGDCVPHRHFVKEYRKNLKKGYFYIGRAAMLDEEITVSIKKYKSIRKLSLLSILLSSSIRKKNAFYFPYFNLFLKIRGLVGRNWGIHKQHLIDINGFDNDYVYAGVGEDTDIEWRLLANGIKPKSMKNKSIVYHLYHARAYSEADVSKSFDLFEDKKKMNNIKCLNGLEQVSIQ